MRLIPPSILVITCLIALTPIAFSVILSSVSLYYKITQNESIIVIDQNGSTLRTPPKGNATKIILLTTISLVVTWVPYFVTSIAFAACDEESTPGKCDTLRFLVASPLAILGFLNSLLAPMIFIWWYDGFKSIMKMSKRKSTAISSFNKNTGSRDFNNGSLKNNSSEIKMDNISVN